MYKDGKNYKQTAKELQKKNNLVITKTKLLQIAVTEKNYYKSEGTIKQLKV